MRHPLYVGWLFAFWATPTMTVTHLFFAVVTTAYILVAIQLEERDLVNAFGADLRELQAPRPHAHPGLRRPIRGDPRRDDGGHPVSGRGWRRRFGAAGFVFFLAKGLLWLAGPLLLAAMR